MDKTKEMTNGNDCAYPADSNTQTEGGITKREYFAAMAMQGILSNSKDWTDSDRCLNWVSESSVKYADSLIEALNKTPNH